MAAPFWGEMGDDVLADRVRVDSFTEFVSEAEPRIRRALTASYGAQAGREAAAEAFVYAWRNWERIADMENPHGYLYRVGSNAAKKPKRRELAADFSEIADRVPWVEPGLGPALASLPDQQRTVVALVHAYEWSLSEVADLLGISKSTVQTHEQRAMKSLRRNLGVNA